MLFLSWVELGMGTAYVCKKFRCKYIRIKSMEYQERIETE